MQDKFCHKINKITIDEQNQEFCISHDNGIKTFCLDDFKEKETSDNIDYKLWSISLAHLIPIYEDLVAFIGSPKNIDFPPNILFILDIKSKKIILKKEFNKEITNFKCASSFILIAFGPSLDIYFFDKEKNELELKEEHKIETNSLFECWAEKQDEILHNLYLAYPLKYDLIIYYYTIKEWSYGNKLVIKSPVNIIQNLFYVKKINQIFISDETAKYIYGFDIDNGAKKLCLYRGFNPGFITSVALLNDGKYLAVNNINRTIHIYNLDINTNAFSLSNVVNRIFYDIQEIYPKQRIYYNDIFVGEEGSYYEKDFTEKGAMLYSDNNDELRIITYNGFAIKVKIDFENGSYKIDKKDEYVQKKIVKLNLCSSGLEFGNQ